MNQGNLKKLIEKYQENTASATERKLLEDWLQNLQESGSAPTWEDKEIDELFKTVPLSPDVRRLKPKRWIYTAAAVFMAFIGFYALYLNKTNSITSQEIALEQVMPAEETAKLILDNGEMISLDEQKTDLHVRNGQLSYTDGSTIRNSPLKGKTLTISIPKGKKYTVTLSDGTKVWLNAATTFKYPANFEATSREVELEGEAYFEVAPSFETINNKRNRVPFIVKTESQKVEVLGTHFNISAYREMGHVYTTLLEGAVNVSNKYGQSVRLRPGQQSMISSSTPDIKVATKDEEAVLGWKNDLFVFHDSNLKEILQEVERWYDIDIAIKEWPKEKFYGEIHRNVPLSEVLKMIQMSSTIKFKVISEGEERRLLMQ